MRGTPSGCELFFLFLSLQASQAHVMRVECNLLSHKRVGVVLQATVKTLYEK